MLLAIDVGNTNTVLGVYQGKKLLDSWRLETHARRTYDEYGILVRQFFSYSGIDPAGIKHVAVSSVVPPLQFNLEKMSERYFRTRPMFVGPGVKTGMPILYDNPREVGADRIANAVGALDMYGGPAVVVDFGTATTFDAISADGEYLGGAIVPGIEISMDALFARAAWLRRVELVDGMVRRFEEELGKSNVIATGGLGALIAPLSDTIEHLEPWLTLHGLRLIHQKNAGSP